MAQPFRQFLDSLGPNNRKLPIDVLRRAWLRTTGQGPTTGGERKDPPASSPPPAAPGDAPLPASAALEDRIIDFDQRITNLPATFDPQRRSLAATTAAGLASSGLFDDAALQERKIGGSTVFNIEGQRPGFAFTDALTDIGGRAAAAGTFSSSFTRDARARAARNLFNRREGALRDFGFAQADITQNQQQSLQGLLSGRLGARADLTAFQASQPVDVPPEPPKVSTVNPTTADVQTPNINKPRLNFAAGNQATLQAKLDKRFGTGTYQVKKRGPKVGGFVAILRGS